MNYNNWTQSMSNQEEICPGHFREIEMDLCQDYQMQGNAEFVPRMLEDELEEKWIRQCKVCDGMRGRQQDPFAQPEMNLE